MKDYLEIYTKIALEALEIIKPHLIVRWEKNESKLSLILKALDDYFFKVVNQETSTYFSGDEVNEIFESLIEIAKARFPSK